MKEMHKLKEMLERELHELGEKGKLSAGDVDTIYKLASSVKNLDRIEMYSEENGRGRRSYDGGMSYRGGNWQAEGEYGDSYEDGMSNARRGMHYVRGHYSRDGGNYDGGGSSYREGSYEGGRSSRRGYSRDEGKEEMMGMLDDMMNQADSEKQREALRRCREELQRI